MNAALEARSLRVLVVAFGGEEGARLWLEQTGCAFDMLLDPHRKIYRHFGLGSSCARVMRFGVLLQYSEYKAVDRDFPDVPPRLLEDIFQMGGDFLLSEEGTVLLSHICKNPMDRPTVGDVLQAADAASSASRP
uniref:Selenoprotein L n=1 Tax=Scophthalmus maximus TaxID=52904 RepID=A0A8D3CZL0_SCOMX